MDIRSKLIDLVTENLKEGHFLVDVVASSKQLSKITVIIDGDQGITIDDCGKLSRELSAKLDEMNFGPSHYLLQVSTPGLDHPLKLKRQFTKNIGRQLKVHRKDQTLLTGKLIESDETKIVLREEIKDGKKIVEKEAVIAFEEIEKAFVMVSFK